MSQVILSNLKSFLKDVREHPDSFPDLHYPTLVKAIKDIENQSLKGHKLDSELFASESYKPCYRKGLMIMTKPGFKDLVGEKVLDGVTVDLHIFSKLGRRVQLVICASQSRPVHVGIRIQYHSKQGWVLYPTITSKVVKDLESILQIKYNFKRPAGKF